MIRLRRREALLGALAVPLAAAPVARAAPARLTDALAEAVRLEEAGALVYEAAARRGLLAAAGRFAEHEREQASELTKALEAFGGAPPGAVAESDLDGLVPGFPQTGTEGELATYAIRVEQTALTAHDAVLRVTDEAAVIRVVAAAMAAAGAHIVVLRERIGADPVPAPLEPTATL